MAKNEEVKTVEMGNGTRERKEYELTQKAKDTRFEVTAVTNKFKNGNTQTLVKIDIDGYTKECRLESDEKGFVLMNGTATKYQATFCEGVSADTGNPYLGLDIWFDADYSKREWFTRLEKIMLEKKGLLRVAKG